MELWFHFIKEPWGGWHPTRAGCAYSYLLPPPLPPTPTHSTSRYSLRPEHSVIPQPHVRVTGDCKKQAARSKVKFKVTWIQYGGWVTSCHGKRKTGMTEHDVVFGSGRRYVKGQDHQHLTWLTRWKLSDLAWAGRVGRLVDPPSRGGTPDTDPADQREHRTEKKGNDITGPRVTHSARGAVCASTLGIRHGAARGDIYRHGGEAPAAGSGRVNGARFACRHSRNIKSVFVKAVHDKEAINDGRTYPSPCLLGPLHRRQKKPLQVLRWPISWALLNDFGLVYWPVEEILQLYFARDLFRAASVITLPYIHSPVQSQYDVRLIFGEVRSRIVACNPFAEAGWRGRFDPAERYSSARGKKKKNDDAASSKRGEKVFDLRPTKVIEVSAEQRQNKRAGETGDPRENLPTSGIVRSRWGTKPHGTGMKGWGETGNSRENPLKNGIIRHDLKYYGFSRDPIEGCCKVSLSIHYVPGVAVAEWFRLLASQQSEPGSIPGRVTPRFPQVIIGRWVFSVISRFPCPCISVLLRSHVISPSSALNASVYSGGAVRVYILHRHRRSWRLNGENGRREEAGAEERRRIFYFDASFVRALQDGRFKEWCSVLRLRKSFSYLCVLVVGSGVAAGKWWGGEGFLYTCVRNGDYVGVTAEEVDGTVPSVDDRAALVAVSVASDLGITDEEVDGIGKTGDILLEEEIEGEKPLADQSVRPCGNYPGQRHLLASTTMRQGSEHGTQVPDSSLSYREDDEKNKVITQHAYRNQSFQTHGLRKDAGHILYVKIPTRWGMCLEAEFVERAQDGNYRRQKAIRFAFWFSY
ncbi:hypothetical protein PR048_032210 [Dryococelus australis]|uniref:Uncharacterized protein n=1 Tax=Dryococelus australis TaxID=614101 RepID=A0ABQ9G4K6_9NEOP|nr:hypothetical protein PR048_032210 [Dryococelus australis]